MARFELGVNSVAAAAAAAYLEIRSPTKPVSVLELGFFTQAATASSVGIGRPAAIGVTPTSPQTVLSTVSTSLTGTVQTASAWGTAPTVPANHFRRLTFPASIGAGAILQWPVGDLVIPTGGSLVLWNFGGAAGSILSCYVAVEEF